MARGVTINFYKHHLGDYDGATAHLSWDEDMAYTRLLRAYYRRERPLSDAAEAYRLVRASSRIQKAAVDTVLAEFFTQQADGWHNKRSDEEIEEYLAGADEREEKAAHETERLKRHRERRKELFETLRERGIIPAWNVSITELQRLCNAPATRTGDVQNEPATATRTSTQEPVPRTINQEPRESVPATPAPARKNGKDRATQLADDFDISDTVSAWATREGFKELSTHLEAFKNKCRAKGYAYINWDAAFMEAIRADWAGVNKGVRH